MNYDRNILDGDLIESVFSLSAEQLEEVCLYVTQSMITASERISEDPCTPQELIARVENIQQFHA